MRRVILIVLTLLVLTGAFAGLLLTQGRFRATADVTPPRPASRPAEGDAHSGSFGPTRSAWLTMYDAEVTGLPKVRFRGDEITPQTGDQMLVQRPQVEFYIGPARSEVIRVIGKTGLVIMPGEGPRIRSDLTPTRTNPPTRGQMTDVTVWYFRSQEAAAANQPDMTMTLPNAYFDNERYEIATEDYVDASGKKIVAEEVPVKLRGEDFDFDGRGLVIRWDDASQRLRSLVIHHGEQLVIKKPLDRMREKSAGRPSTVVPGVMLAAADPKQAVSAAASATTAAMRIYRATFQDNVTVTQVGQQLASASAMHVDFLDRNSPGMVRSAPSTRGGQPNGQGPTTAPQARPAEGQAKPMGVDTEQPIVVKWTGPLVVSPAPEEPLRPESTDDAVIRLAGSDAQPTKMQSDGRTIEAQWVAYRVAEQFAWVEGAQNRPVRMTDADGSVLLTPQLRYSERSGVAELRGPSSAQVVSNEGGEKQVLKATWQDLAEARFGAGGKSRGISSLLLRGDVQAQHPRIREFKSGELLLEFDQPSADKSTEPAGQLKRLVARKDVNCVLIDQSNESQSIRAQELELQMARAAGGKPYPGRVVAAGSVVAGNATEKISADRIEADLDEPTKSASADKAGRVEFAGLRNLLAVGNVQLNSARGETVKGDRLQMRQSREKTSWILLEGKPAVVAQEGTVLAGQFIELDTASERALITGGGSVRMSDTQGIAKTQPVEIKWSGDGRLDGPENKVTAAGNVQVHYVDADGAINDAAGDRVEIGLGQKAKSAEKGDKPGQAGNARRLNFMSDRFARQITLLPVAGGDIRLQSLLPGPNNTILRQVNLLGPRLDVMLEPSETGGSRVQRLVVPGGEKRPGRLLYVELPPATKAPVQTGDPLQTHNLPGATAMAWRERLEYDRAASTVTLTGGVMIRHEPQLPAGKSFQIDAQTIVTDVAAKADRSTAGPISAMEVRKVTLTGSPVHLLRDDVDLTAPKIEVSPASSTISASGTELAGVNVERGRVTGSMQRVEINTSTNMINFEGAQGIGRQ